MVRGAAGLQGSILPGVTRQSIIDLASARGYTVKEELISVHEAMEADEIFTSGTAVVVCSVGSLTYRVGSPYPLLPDQAVLESIPKHAFFSLQFNHSGFEALCFRSFRIYLFGEWCASWLCWLEACLCLCLLH